MWTKTRQFSSPLRITITVKIHQTMHKTCSPLHLYMRTDSENSNTTCFQKMNLSSDSSEGGEFTGSPMTVCNSTKFLAGKGAWDKNEAKQR